MLKQHLPAIVGIAAISYFAAGFLGPADPISPVFIGSGIFPVALASYLIGVWTAPPAAEHSRRDRIRLGILAASLALVSIVIASLAFQSFVDRWREPPPDMDEVFESLRE